MKSLFLSTAVIVGSLSQMAPAASQTEILRNRCAEQERIIKSLEAEIDSMHALLAKNNLRPTKASIAAATPTTSASSSSSSTYTIRKGDNLSKVARANGISLNALLAANKGIDPRRLRVGQTINLPSKGKNVSQAPAATTPTQILGSLPDPITPAKHSAQANHATVKSVSTSSTTTSYTVQPKDTLYNIARKYNTSVANILELNKGLSANKLQVGQTIQIASNPTAKSVSAVPAAKEAATPSKAVAKATLPDVVAPTSEKPVNAPVAAPEKKTPAAAAAVVNTAPHAKVRTVAVTRQMTFGEFANTYGASVEQLNEMNNLRLTKSTVLAQGSELYIPNTQL